MVYQVRAFSVGDVPHVPYEDVGGLRAVLFRELFGELLPLEFELPLDSAHFLRLFAEGKSRQDSEQGKYRGSYCGDFAGKVECDMGEAYRRVSRAVISAMRAVPAGRPKRRARWRRRT